MNNKSLKRTWEEKVNICKQWQLSGLSMSKFCAQQSIALATFSGWCARLWPSRRKLPEKLCPVQIIQPQNHPETQSQAMAVELNFPHSITARINATDKQFVFLLRELLDATTTVR